MTSPMSKVFEGLFFEVRVETILIEQMISLVSINRIGFGMRQIEKVFEWLELFVFGQLDVHVQAMEKFFQRQYNEVVLYRFSKSANQMAAINSQSKIKFLKTHLNYGLVSK